MSKINQKIFKTHEHTGKWQPLLKIKGSQKNKTQQIKKTSLEMMPILKLTDKNFILAVINTINDISETKFKIIE